MTYITVTGVKALLTLYRLKLRKKDEDDMSKLIQKHPLTRKMEEKI